MAPLIPNIRVGRRRVFIALVITLSLVTIGGGVGVSVVLSYLKEVQANLPAPEKLLSYNPSTPTKILSRNGEVIGELFEEQRYPVKIDQVSPLLVKAFIAAEDRRFFQHNGLEIRGIIRAGFYYIFQTKSKQGGSTITQQMVKLLFLSRERTLERKLKDMLLAQEVERILDKKSILEIYLNTIYLGNKSYGVEAAARNYFRKSNKDMTLAEVAIVAGLGPAPSLYDPTRNIELAKQRQRYVLDQMADLGYITDGQRKAALNEPMKIFSAETPNLKKAPFFLMEVQKQLERMFPKETILTGGFQVQTTIDLSLQEHVRDAIDGNLKALDKMRYFPGPRARHGKNYAKRAKDLLASHALNDDGREPAIVISVIRDLHAVVVATPRGIGLLLNEDHTWIGGDPKSTKQKRIRMIDEALAVGDEISVRLLQRKTPERVRTARDQLKDLAKFFKLYLNKPPRTTLAFYEVADVAAVEGAALVMNAQTGEILAMAGGTDFLESQFNRATQAKRQVGSAVKPLFVSKALDNGFHISSLIDSPPVVINGWKPENYGHNLLKRTTLRRVLINSYNLPSIQLYMGLGDRTAVSHFHKMNLMWNRKDGGLSLALGSGTASLLEMAQAYSVFANDGKLSEGYCIQSISDSAGKILFDRKKSRWGMLLAPIMDHEKVKDPEERLQLITPQSAFITTHILKDALRFGTGSTAAGVSLHAAGKTGTTNNYTDAWFMGYVPNLVTGVWVGFDDPKVVLGSGATGGKVAAPIWRDIMNHAVKIYPHGPWVEPENIEWHPTNLETGEIVTRGTSLPYVAGVTPGESSARNALGVPTEGDADEKESNTTSNLRSLF